MSESALTGVKASHVLRGGAAEAAGVAPGDELLAIAGWRLRRLDEARVCSTPGEPAELLVARDQRVLSLSLTLPARSDDAGAIALLLADKPTKAALRSARHG